MLLARHRPAAAGVGARRHADPAGARLCRGAAAVHRRPAAAALGAPDLRGLRRGDGAAGAVRHADARVRRLGADAAAGDLGGLAGLACAPSCRALAVAGRRRPWRWSRWRCWRAACHAALPPESYADPMLAPDAVQAAMLLASFVALLGARASASRFACTERRDALAGAGRPRTTTSPGCCWNRQPAEPLLEPTRCSARCRDRSTVAYVQIDLDRFKHVNDLPRPRVRRRGAAPLRPAPCEAPPARHRRLLRAAATRSSRLLLARQRPPPARSACSRELRRCRATAAMGLVTDDGRTRSC
ncbi:MAG: hypothetical protein MZW92_62560 [Comamonadaceae bacterium]|nr:hypothetical protein [Comamonadaceae bacterium]